MHISLFPSNTPSGNLAARLWRSTALSVLLSVTGASLLACGPLQSLTGGGKGGAAEAAGLLKAGDVAGAAAKYEAALTANPADIDAAIGAAYLRALAGKPQDADAALASVEASAGPKLAEVKLRRAMLAVQLNDFDKVKEHGMASGLPAGKLLQAEAELADGNRPEAKLILESIQGEAGPVGETAKQYLALMADPNPLVAGLAETQALWALGAQKVAVRSVEELVKAYAEAHEDGAEQILIWAGRAAAMGEADVAFNLLDALTVPPPGQVWRVAATKSIAWCAQGNGAECLAGFEAVAAIAPQDGLADAKVTAATVIAGRDPATARQLVQGVQGDGAARVLAMLGDKAAAAAVASDPILKKQLGG